MCGIIVYTTIIGMLLIVSGNGILDLIRNVQSVNALLELKQKYVNVAFFFPVNTVMV